MTETQTHAADRETLTRQRSRFKLNPACQPVERHDRVRMTEGICIGRQGEVTERYDDGSYVIRLDPSAHPRGDWLVAWPNEFELAL